LAENHFNVLHVNGHFLKIKQNAMRNLKRENHTDYSWTVT